MIFDKLHEMIPYATGGKNHVMTMTPYNGVVLAMPGRHQKDTDPIGGDFVVMVSDFNLGWVNHQFTHDDIFQDFEKKYREEPEVTKDFFRDYVKVVFGDDPAKLDWHRPSHHPKGLDLQEATDTWDDTLHPQTMLYGLQCLAIAEHRRYHMHERLGGGRYLPMRLAYGIVQGAWTAEDCKQHQRRGRPGLDLLQKLKEFDASSKAIREAFNLSED